MTRATNTPVMSPVETPNRKQQDEYNPPKRTGAKTNGGLTDDTMKIVRLQAMVRGFLERQKYKVLQNDMQMKHTLYFKKDELMETLRAG